jgi:hypothetical protein
VENLLCSSSDGERAKLGYFWRHAYGVPRSGPYLGCVVNPDTGLPVIVDDGRLTAAQFEQFKISETIESRSDKPCRPFHSPLWQADANKIRRSTDAGSTPERRTIACPEQLSEAK